MRHPSSTFAAAVLFAAACGGSAGDDAFGSSSSALESKLGVGEPGACGTCVRVIERIKKGTNVQLPSICDEAWGKELEAGSCGDVLRAVEVQGGGERSWLFEGCYKYEIYQAKEWVKPCPSHVTCTVLRKASGEPFCKPMPMEDPFE